MQHGLSHKPASSPCTQWKKQRSVLILKHNQAKRTLETTIMSSLLLPREFLRIDLARCSLLVSFKTYFTHETYTCGCNFIKIKQEWCHPDTSRLTIPTWSVLLLPLRQHMDILGQTKSTSSSYIFSSQKSDKPCRTPSKWPLPWQ